MNKIIPFVSFSVVPHQSKEHTHKVPGGQDLQKRTTAPIPLFILPRLVVVLPVTFALDAVRLGLSSGTESGVL